MEGYLRALAQLLISEYVGFSEARGHTNTIDAHANLTDFLHNLL